MPAILTLALLAGCMPPSADEGSPSDGASASTTVSAQSTPSASATPTSDVEPTPSTSAAPEAKVHLGYGARLEIKRAVDLHESPAADAPVLARIPAGESVVVDYRASGEGSAGPIFGPILAGGWTWYPVAPADLDQLAPPGTVGWMAVEEAEATVAPTSCLHHDAPTVSDLARMSPQERLVCFGDRTLELEGDMPLSGLGGMVFGTWAPMWLAYPVNDGTPLRSADEPRLRIGVFFAPGVETPELPPGTTDPNQLVSVVAHFDDPASADCKVEAPEARSRRRPKKSSSTAQHTSS